MMNNSNGMNAGSSRRYVDILTDAGFKAVFGDQNNKDVLIDFLNVVLPESRMVSDIEYSTTEIPGFTPENKSVRLDLRCTGTDGTEFIVEMQQSRQEHFFKRCVEYASKVYDSGSRRGYGYGEIPPVYFIGILAADMGFDRSSPEWNDRYVSEYTFREKSTGEVPDESISIIFVELDRFSKEVEECVSLVEKWCYALKYVGRLHELPDGLRIRAFERLFAACEIARFSPEKKLQYDKEMITERDYMNILATARKDGFAEGKAEVARALLSLGQPEDLILQATGLTEKELSELKESMH